MERRRPPARLARIILYRQLAIVDLVSFVIGCNCAIASILVLLTVWIVGWRKQVVAWGNWFDRWERESSITLSDAPRAIAAMRIDILNLRQIYRQQVQAVDRLRQVGSAIGMARSVLRNRRNR